LAGATSAIYLVIDNGTAQAESLLSVETAAAAQAEFHESQMNDQNMMSMQPRESVVIPAGGQVAFAPGGLHVMLIGLTQELQAGDTFSITLRFEKTGALSLEVPVQAP
jgi:copper(I)-binding protein